ncbi:hypothetical protein SAMN05216179_0779 [Gracilibacillus kekensis]|uniref:Uncharacterized protein n=1 Tax=Gracilibacillus kekensis TaxID=1027249 RepID=A0A1M7KMW3_9BACI|nr:hypothetical protein SAMN05216179_0779 [Gracilibacillus kekensis]
MRMLLVVLFLLLIVGFSVVGYTTSTHSVKDDVIEMEQEK